MDLHSILNDHNNTNQEDKKTVQPDPSTVPTTAPKGTPSSSGAGGYPNSAALAPNYNFTYDFTNLLGQQGALPAAHPHPLNHSMTTPGSIPFIQQFPAQAQQALGQQYKNFYQHPETTARAPQGRDWRGSNGSNPSAKEQGSSSKAGKDHKIDEKRVARVEEVQIALRIIQRFYNSEIRNDIGHLEGGVSLTEFPEQPVIFSMDAYENPSSWNSIWKPEMVERIFPDFCLRDQKNDVDLKKSIREFRRHTENTSPDNREEIWFATDLPLTHQASCLNSKKNRNCLGCSSFWKSVQLIQEDLRPWGNPDLLHYDPEHSETFQGHIAMNGSFIPPTVAMLACDTVNTLNYSDDREALALWGFVSPSDRHKLSEDESLGMGLFDQKTLVDPLLLEKKAKILWGIQKQGQTVVVPSGWTYFVVYTGSGLHFSSSWNILRLKHIMDARREVERNRTIGLYRPVNVSSLVVNASYQMLDELEMAETTNTKLSICNSMLKLQPILRTLILEELLGEHINLSSLNVLIYDLAVDKFVMNGRRNPTLSVSVMNEVFEIRATPFSGIDADTEEDEEDLQFYCSICKYILFNTRRTSTSTKGFHMCEGCYNTRGKKPSMKMKRFRKQTVQSILDLSQSIHLVLLEHEQTGREPAPSPVVSSKKRDRKEMKEAEPEPENYDEEVIDCICGNNKDLGFMISCEKCYAWLHGKCVGISKRNEPEMYYCPRCVKKAPVAINAKLSPKDISPTEKLREYNL